MLGEIDPRTGGRVAYGTEKLIIYFSGPVTSRGVPGWGLKSDQPPGSLCAPPRMGHNRDPGGG